MFAAPSKRLSASAWQRLSRAVHKNSVSSSTTARVAVVGSGRMGKIRSSLVQANPRLDLVAIVDSNEHSDGEVLASLYQVGKWESVDALLNEDHSLQGLIVCTPTSSHPNIIRSAVDSGVSVFVEKPVASTAEEIRETFAYFEAATPFSKNNSQLCCGYQRRFDPSYVAVTKMVQRGDLGLPVMASLFFADHPAPPPEFMADGGGNIFMDLSAHDVDYITHTLQDDVVSVYAKAQVVDGVDHATIWLEFSKGTVATLFLSRAANYGYDQRCELFGSNGGYACVQNPLEHSAVAADSRGIHQARLQYSFPERFQEAFRLELESFADVMLDNKPWPITENQCYRVQQIADAAQRSFELGRPVEMDSFRNGS